MKILSINTRGSNSYRKRKEIKELIRRNKVDIVCLQESKKKVVTKNLCESIWPDKDFNWIYSGSKGASGGLITIWKKQALTLVQQWGTTGALGLMGIWLPKNVTFHLVNIYAPCDTKDEKVLWEEVQSWLKPKPLDFWCVCGDFNST
ncbi:hypothetical protein ACS0TY_012537 [Phlomoides rotata]